LKLLSKKCVLTITCLLLLIPAGGHGSDDDVDEFGGMVGVSLTFGSHVNRLGVIAKAYYAGSQFQANTELGLHYNLKALGPPLAGPEARASLGGVFAWGDTDVADNLFLSPVSNQTGHKYSLAYAYNYYWDKIGTSQPTGTVALQWDAVHLISENDILAGRGGDRYRTGAATVAYRTEKVRSAIKAVLWTGDTGKNTRKVKDTGYPSRFGYRDMSRAPHGAYSHGILSAQVQYVWCGFQSIGAEIGMDSEKIRHRLQNEFIHDMVFIPGRWVTSDNPHVPMRDAQGGPYLFQEGQTIKPAEPFAAISMNPSLFY